jgi:hypothetical protein
LPCAHILDRSPPSPVESGAAGARRHSGLRPVLAGLGGRRQGLPAARQPARLFARQNAFQSHDFLVTQDDGSNDRTTVAGKNIATRSMI